MSAWQPIEAVKPKGKVFVWARDWDAAYIAEWTWQDCDGGEEGEHEYPGFWGWSFTDDSVSFGCQEGFLGWNEDIEDGLMPTLWMPVPTHGDAA